MDTYRMKNFQRERLELEIIELICELMDEQGISKDMLADELNVSYKDVEKLMRDGGELTIKELSDIFYCLGKSLRVVARPLSVNTPELKVENI